MLAKHVSYIEEIQEYLTEEKMQRVLYFKNEV